MLKKKLEPYLDRIRRRELTNREVAALLNTNETYVCRVLKGMGIEREEIVKPPTSKELNAARTEHRELMASTMTAKEAAKAAGCSLRTIYRIRGKK